MAYTPGKGDLEEVWQAYKVLHTKLEVLLVGAAMRPEVNKPVIALALAALETIRLLVAATTGMKKELHNDPT